MRVVVNGATGVLGHALIEQCLNNGDEVMAICRRNSDKNNSLPIHENLLIFELDLDDYKVTIKKIKENIIQFNKYDVFYHFAWMGTDKGNRNDFDLQNKNVEYSIDAVRFAQALGCKTFIGAGSQAEFGCVEGIIGTKTIANPVSEYGKAKLKAGFETRKLCNELHMNHIWTRVLSVYGPYNGEDSLIISSLRKMISREKTFFTSGEQIWDYLYSEDAGEAFRLLGEKGIDGKTYVIGSGKAYEIRECIKIMARLTGYEDLSGIGSIQYSENQIMHLEADISELTSDTGFVPSFEFEDGIRHTIEYINNN